MVHDFYPDRPVRRPSSGEWIAVSVNLLHGLYLDPDRSLAVELGRRGWVTSAQIRLFSDARERLGLAGDRSPGLGEWLEDEGLLDPQQRRIAERSLLTSWFEKLRSSGELLGRAGDSIRVYRVP